MNQRGIEAFMKESGFKFIRSAKTGDIWHDGITRVMVGYNMTNWRNIKNLEAEVKRAIKARPGHAIDARPDAITPERRMDEQDYFKDKKKIEEREAKAKKPLTDTPFKTLKAPFNEVTPKETQDHRAAQIEFAREQAAKEAASLKQETPKPKEPEMQVVPNGKITIEPVRKKIQKYDAKTRHRVWSRIRELRAQGHNHVEIAMALDIDGFRMPNGYSEMTPAYVASSIHNMVMQGLMDTSINKELPKRAAPIEISAPAPTPPPVQVAPPAPAPEPKPAPVVTAIPHTHVDKKAVLNTVQDILTNPNLGDRTKLRMIAAYIEGELE